MDYSVSFWNRIASRYAKTPVPDEAVYQQKLEITQKYFRPDMTVLEFGCGTGSTAIIHAPRVKKYLAIDVSPRMIDIAKGKLLDTDIHNLTFKTQAMEELDVEDASFDAILGLSILHLMNDPDAAIRRVSKMLKPGGVFVSSTACLGDTMPLFRYVAPIGKFLGLIPKVQMLTHKQLISSLEQAGFTIDYEMAPKGKSHAYFLVAQKRQSVQPEWTQWHRVEE